MRSGKFAKGKRAYAISDIGGHRVPYTRLKTQWDGLRVDYAFLSTNDNGGLGIHHLLSLSVSLEMLIQKILDTNKS